MRMRVMRVGNESAATLALRQVQDNDREQSPRADVTTAASACNGGGEEARRSLIRPGLGRCPSGRDAGESGAKRRMRAGAGSHRRRPLSSSWPGLSRPSTPWRRGQPRRSVASGAAWMAGTSPAMTGLGCRRSRLRVLAAAEVSQHSSPRISREQRHPRRRCGGGRFRSPLKRATTARREILRRARPWRNR